MNTRSFDPVARAESWLRWFRLWRLGHLISGIDRGAVLEHVDDAGEMGPRYAFMTLMSAGIAMLGLLQGSGAVIIGAMLISPLMGPIVEMGMALATFDFRTLRSALKTMAIGVVLAVAICFLIVWVSPLQEPTQEIISRTEPTLFDLLVAIFSGLAGAYATVTRKGETIVGVAIATALMPPLAVVGYGLAIGNFSIAGGAGFLFMTNLLAIALSVTIMARWYGFGREDTPKQTAWQAALIVAIFVLLSIPLGLALRNIAARSLVDRGVRSSLEQAAREDGGRITTLRVDHGGEGLNVEAVLLTPHYRPQLSQELEREFSRRFGQPAKVDLREVLTADAASVAQEKSTLDQLRNSINQLESAAAREQATRASAVQEQTTLDTRAVAALGSLEAPASGAALWRLRGDAGLDIGAARQLEARLQHGGERAVQVIPAPQPLPLIGFGDDRFDLDAAAIARLQDIAWALQRWQAGTVRVIGYAGGDTALARKRADTVAAWLQTQQLHVDAIDAGSRTASQALVQRHGEDALRVVRVESGPAQ